MKHQPNTTHNIRCPAQIRIGTRGSQLAVAQATEVKNRLLGAFPELTQEQIVLIKITTTGDKIQDRHLADIGGKGLFTKEIEEALLRCEIDMAVHSMKDMPAKLPTGLLIECILEREDPRDAFISHKVERLKDLPKGAVIGTSSVRRQAQLLRLRPDLNMSPFRGNVGTRLAKLETGQVDATILAVAGLKRIDMADHITEILEPEHILPAVAQGAIGVECAADNLHIREVLNVINHPESSVCIAAERAFLAELEEGSCTTPIGALAALENNQIHLRCLLASTDGRECYETKRSGGYKDAAHLGADAGKELKKKGKSILKK